MGILAIGVALGGLGSYGAILHAINHSLTKGMLFLVAGNILAQYHTKSINSISGVINVLPGSGILWMAGLFAITGTPPFGLFLSEFTIVRAAFNSGHIITAVILLAALGVIFISMTKIVIGMVYGSANESDIPAVKEFLTSIIPPAVLCVAVLVLGVYIPPALNKLLTEAALLLGGN